MQADAFEAAGQKDAAVAILQPIVEAYPTNARLKQRLEALKGQAVASASCPYRLSEASNRRSSASSPIRPSPWTKLVAGLLGNSYALVADAVESTADIFSSLIVWGGLRISVRDPNEHYPFGYGKAEPLAATVVSLMLIGASVGIAVEAITEIKTPHHAPEPWTLAVLVVVVITKALLSRRVRSVAAEIGSTAVQAPTRGIT